MLPVVVTGLGYSATNNTSKGEGSSLRFSSLRRAAEKTSNGPQKSSTSISSKRTIPTRFLSNCFLLPFPKYISQPFSNCGILNKNAHHNILCLKPIGNLLQNTIGIVKNAEIQVSCKKVGLCKYGQTVHTGGLR